LDRIGQSSGQGYSIVEAAIRLLLNHDFPGNIRELRNILWVSAVNAPGGHIGLTQIAAALPFPTQETHRGGLAFIQGMNTPPGDACVSGLSLRHVWDPDNLAVVLRRHRGNRRAVAQELGVSERTIYRKLRELGLN
jgi:transcriptional regulator of acetoin/glycerol metabolism